MSLFSVTTGLSIARQPTIEDLNTLADNYQKYDLRLSDRDMIRQLSKRADQYRNIAQVLCFGVGYFLAYRRVSKQTALFNAFQTMEKPSILIFAGGRAENLPDLKPPRSPNIFRLWGTYLLFGYAGISIGDIAGMVIGARSAFTTIRQDPEVNLRIGAGFRKYQVEILRKEVDRLEGEKKAELLEGGENVDLSEGGENENVGLSEGGEDEDENVEDQS